MGGEDLSNIKNLLEVLVALSLAQISNSGEEISDREKIRRLANLQLPSSTIARILGTTSGYVSKEISVMKSSIKSRRKNGKKKR